MRLLLVEDSRRLREQVALALKRSGYAVDAAENGEDGLWMAQNHDYDAAILDIMMPGIDGLTLLKRLRDSGKETPVMFLTARDKVEDKVNGLRIGADDYLVKPFALAELLARVEVLCRRSYHNATPVLKIDDLEVDTTAKSASRTGQKLDLTAREYAILELLMHRKGHTISRTQIEEHIYDEMVSPMSNVVDSAVCALRKKIAVNPDCRPLIHTRRGQGYVLETR
ncbi:MAG: response regulator transcription factor [Verrucomicrobiota bacterium]